MRILHLPAEFGRGEIRNFQGKIWVACVSGKVIAFDLSVKSLAELLSEHAL